MLKNAAQSFVRLPMPLRLGMAGLLVCIVGGLVYALGGGQNAMLTIAVFAIVGLLLGLVGWFVKARSKKKSAQLENALDNDGPESGLADESEKRERQEVRQQWQKAIEETKNAGFSLYTLPWYLLVGEPAGGKSTTLRASGLEFPVGAEAISGLGGTRNCDWWFTNEAVILDTAGRFTFEEKNAPDAAGWEEFLKLAQQSRPRCPINGCIIAIPMTSLLGDEPDVIEQKATQIREKLHELEQKLSIQFPVYVLVTKCDKVLGFTEFFSRLPALEQRQLFGWSKPGDYRETVPNEQWKTTFSDLNDQLVKWRNQFLEDDAEAGDVDRLYAFPEEFATIGAPLEDYLTRIFVENRYVDPLFLRGVYFTSGIQKGAPIVSACKNLLRSASEGTDEVHLEQIFSKSRAFFIRDFYRKKVFKEQGLIQPTRAAMKRQQLVERVGYSALGVVGLLLLIFLIWGGVAVGSRSTEYKNSLAEFDDQAKRWPGAPPFSAATDLSESVEKLRTDGLAPTGLGTLFGDFARGGVSAEITKAYRSRFTRSFLNRLAEKTRSAFRVPPQTWEHYLAYENAAHSFLAFAVSGERTEDGAYDLGSLSPDKLETIEPFLALCAAAGQPVSNAEEWTTAFQQLRSTVSATLEGEDALSDYSSAFVIDRPGAVLMLDELRNFWVRVSHSHVDEKTGLPHDFGASDNEQFRHWRQWCEIYSLNNALTKQLKVLTEVTRDVDEYDAAVRALTDWCEAFGIEAEGTDHLLAQVARMKSTLGVRAPEGDAPPAPSTVKLQRAAALVEALKERARRAFEPFGSVDYDTGSGILAGLVADRKVTVDDRFSNRVLTEFDYKADVHEFVAIEHTGGETTVAPTERFTQLAGATGKLEQALGTATLREAPKVGSDGNLDAWTDLADWLDARVDAIAFESSGYKQFDDMMAQFVPLAQRAHTTRALETFRSEVLADLESDAAKELVRGFATGSVSLLGGSAFEFQSGKEIPSDALFREAAVRILDFASRLERYAVGPRDVVAYDDLGREFRDRIGALTVRYFDEYRAAWTAAFDATQEALAAKEATKRSILASVPQDSFDKLDDPEYLVDLVAHLRQQVTLPEPEGLSSRLKAKSLAKLEDLFGEFSDNYELGDPPAEGEPPADPLTELAAAYQTHLDAVTEFTREWPKKSKEWPIQRLFEGESEEPALWDQLTTVSDWLGRRRDRISVGIRARAESGVYAAQAEIINRFQDDFDQIAKRRQLSQVRSEFPFTRIPASGGGNVRDLDPNKFEQLYESFKTMRADWAPILGKVDGDPALDRVLPEAAAGEVFVPQRIEFLNRFMALGDFARIGQTDRVVPVNVVFNLDGSSVTTHLKERFTQLDFKFNKTTKKKLLLSRQREPLTLDWDFGGKPPIAFEFSDPSRTDKVIWPEPEQHPEQWYSWLALPRVIYEFAPQAIVENARSVRVRLGAEIGPEDGERETVEMLMDFSLGSDFPPQPLLDDNILTPDLRLDPKDSR